LIIILLSALLFITTVAAIIYVSYCDHERDGFIHDGHHSIDSLKFIHHATLLIKRSLKLFL